MALLRFLGALDDDVLLGNVLVRATVPRGYALDAIDHVGAAADAAKTQ